MVIYMNLEQKTNNINKLLYEYKESYKRLQGLKKNYKGDFMELYETFELICKRAIIKSQIQILQSQKIGK